MASEVSGDVTIKAEVLSQGAHADNGADASAADINDKIKDEPMSDQDHTTDDNHNDSSNNNNDAGVDDEGATMGDGEGNGQTEFRSADNDNNSDSMDEGAKTNLIVNYLPQQMTDEQFETLFGQYGPMKSCKIVRNKNTGYSYGFGFADYETHEQALRAIEGLNGHEVDTKKIKVAFARPAGQDIKQANLYVKGVPNAWSQDEVKKVFEPYGQIIQVRVLGNDRGIAFVLFDLRRQAEEAMEALNGKSVEGCEGPLEIKFAADKKSEKRGNNNGSNNNRQASGQTNQGRRRGGDRGGRRDGGRSLSNNRNNNGNDRNRNNQRRGTSQQGRGSGGRGSFNKQGMNNGNSNNNNNYNDQMGGGGIGPMRQQQANRMSRYAPFAPMQQTPMQAAAVPGMMPNPYGYQPQPMLQYMMPSQMMQMSQMAHPHAQQQMQMAGHPMNPYAQMGYAQAAPMAQQTATLSNMYNMASSTMNNAAQMQPQLGQPMNSRGGLPSVGGVGNMSGGGGAGGLGGSSSSGSSGMQQGGNGGSDGITLFVYNIGPTSDESELKSMFAPYGDVLRSNVVRKTPGGETKGFGFVTVRSRDQANAAIAALNGQMRNGKPLQVSFKK